MRMIILIKKKTIKLKLAEEEILTDRTDRFIDPKTLYWIIFIEIVKAIFEIQYIYIYKNCTYENIRFDPEVDNKNKQIEIGG